MSTVEKSDLRELIKAFDSQFAVLHQRSCALIRNTPIELLYGRGELSRPGPAPSMGEQLLRSAAAVERTFGGITANLWDDPFEWTLPENLSTSERVLEYLEEVEATRQRAFTRFAIDEDLLKEVLVPSGNTRSLIALLTETLATAADYQGRAKATLSLVSDGRFPHP